MMTKDKSQFIAFGVGMKILTAKEGNDINSMLDGTHILVSARETTNQIRAAESDGDSSFVATHNMAVTNDGKSGFKFGKASQKELEGVKVELVLCVRRALELSTQDFTVFDGIRTLKEQQQHVKNGTSKTMKSKHLQGLAVDLVPWVDGKPVWDWEKIYPIAFAMDRAATELGIAGNIRWGGAWDRTLADFGGQPSLYFEECQAYQKRHEGKDFIDGPHFEWVE